MIEMTDTDILREALRAMIANMWIESARPPGSEFGGFAQQAMDAAMHTMAYRGVPAEAVERFGELMSNGHRENQA